METTSKRSKEATRTLTMLEKKILAEIARASEIDDVRARRIINYLNSNNKQTGLRLAKPVLYRFI